MSRFTMTLAAAAASATAAIAAVALPAVGADSSNTADSPAKAAADIAAFASCLRGHGLADAPTDPEALKPWLAAREASDPAAVKAALAACSDKGPDERRAVVRGPRIQELVSCLRAHGLDAPTAPTAFKRWLADKEATDRDDLYRVMGACKMSLDPGSPNAAAKPGTCDADARPHSGDAANRGT